MSNDIEKNREELTEAVNSALRTKFFRNLQDITPNEDILALIGSGISWPVIVPTRTSSPFIQKEQVGNRVQYSISGRCVAFVDNDNYTMEFEQDENPISRIYEAHEKFIPVYRQKVEGKHG